eukprot:c19020_g1_i2.p1 GENE.c19020_g1_i2~~c19020_g1_i2.p1  ORF type:complete len:360 (-),score=159.31 c19020_g1_i2:28-1086(-)
MSEAKEISVGLVGFGMVSQVFHAPLLSSHPLFKLSYVVERSSEKSKEKYPDVIVVKTLADLLNTNVELVIIATPSSQHFEHARDALTANKHVIVEKPFTVTSEEAETLINLAKKHSKILTVYHNRRWDSDFLTVKSIIEQKLVGELAEIDIHYDRFRNTFKGGWREKNEPGSGILYDLGSHLIDQALTLLGHRLPDAVFADVRKQREGAETDDYFDVDLRYNDLPSLKITLRSGMLVKKLGPRYAIHGTSGSFVKYGIDVQEEKLKNGLTPKNDDQFGVEPENIWGVLSIDGKDDQVIKSHTGSYLQFYSNVADAIRNNKPLEVAPEHGRDVIKVIEAAIQSSKTGKIVNLL